MSILRMIGDAKFQLKDILCKIGFSDECMHPQPFNYRGADEQLDLVCDLFMIISKYIDFILPK